MRQKVVAAALIGFAALLSGCIPPPPGSSGSGTFELSRIDPNEAADRAITGAALGAALGTGIGATVAISPAIGAVIGAETGATLGGAIGILTTPPLPAYAPIAVPQSEVIPEFYDTWPPGYHLPPINQQVPPPRPG